MSSTLLISVGGTPGPVIFSIRQHHPERVIFFVSPASRTMVKDEILPALLKEPGHLPDHEFVVAPDEQDLGESVFSLQAEVPAALRRLGAADELWPCWVDYTAGTKTMSAALVLAASKYPCRVSYVGTPDASGRTRGGLGVVIDGRERVFRQENPWNRIAWLEARDAAKLFNRGQYGNAARLMRELVTRVDEPSSLRLYQLLGEVFEAFHQWDIFNHKRAQMLLFKHLQQLIDLSQAPQTLFSALKSFGEDVQELSKALRRIQPGQLTWSAIHDLLANALRRSELEQKYEDAVARCYSAIEKTVQLSLLLGHGIDTGNVPLEKLPARLRPEYQRRYMRATRTDSGTVREIKLGARAALELLVELQDPVGLRFQEREQKIIWHLSLRNRSILAHGFDPMKEENFRDIFEDALYLLGASESDLWKFPRLAT